MAEHHLRIHADNEKYVEELKESTPFISTYNDAINYIILQAKRHKLI